MRLPSYMGTGLASITVRYTGCLSVTGYFNHESPIRGETFVTRKITRAVARIRHGLQKKLYLGNLDAKRDWGHAKDYVEVMWLILQQEEPDDYVIATGETHSVREFAELAFAEAGITIGWRGKGVEEEGINEDNGEVFIEIDPRYFRPTEVDMLVGDPAKARERLGWSPKCLLKGLVEEMVKADLVEAEREALLKSNGYRVMNFHE